MKDPYVLEVLRRAAAAGDHAAVLRLARQAHRLTQTQLALRCGYSAASISRFETGRRRLTDTSTLRILATALDIPSGLFGLAPPAPVHRFSEPCAPGVTRVVGVTGDDNEDGDGDVRRRELLVGMGKLGGLAVAGTAAAADPVTARLEAVLVKSSAPAAPVPLIELRAELDLAWKAFAAARYTGPAERLPDLIGSATAARDASTGTEREDFGAALAGAYMLVCELAIKQGQDGIAWVSGDRALRAARDSGKVTSIAAATQAVGMAMRRMGHYSAATDLLVRSAADLGAERGAAPPTVLASYGSLLCTASYAAAQRGDRHKAVELIQEAESTARRLKGSQPETSGRRSFSAANVAVYRIGVHHALGEDGTALDYAGRVEQHKLATPERQARFCIDTARAWERQGSPARAYQALKVAERNAPEEIRRPSIQALVASLLQAPGPTPRGLRGMAARVGAAGSE